MTFLRAHWPILAAALAGAALAWSLKPDPPQPKVEIHDLRHYEDDGAEQVQSHKAEGPSRTTVRKYAPAPAPDNDFHRPNGLEDRLVEETVTETGPVVTDTSSAKVEHKTEDRKVDLTITPAPPKGWALQVGFEDVLGNRVLRAAARRRLLGPVWVEVSAVPARGALGAALAVEF